VGGRHGKLFSFIGWQQIMESSEKEILMPLEKKGEIRKLTEEIIDIKDNTIINQSSLRLFIFNKSCEYHCISVLGSIGLPVFADLLAARETNILLYASS
jgi:hypothetical protein